MHWYFLNQILFSNNQYKEISIKLSQHWRNYQIQIHILFVEDNQFIAFDNRKNRVFLSVLLYVGESDYFRYLDKFEKIIVINCNKKIKLNIKRWNILLMICALVRCKPTRLTKWSYWKIYNIHLLKQSDFKFWLQRVHLNITVHDTNQMDFIKWQR